jgi:hypothetical protein
VRGNLTAREQQRFGVQAMNTCPDRGTSGGLTPADESARKSQ